MSSIQLSDEIKWRLHAIKFNKRLLLSLSLMGPKLRNIISEFEDKRELILVFQDLMEDKNDKMLDLISDFEGDLQDEESFMEGEKLNKTHLLQLRTNYFDQLNRIKKIISALENMKDELPQGNYRNCYNLIARIHNDIVDSLNLENGLEITRRKYGKPKRYTTLTSKKLLELKNLVIKGHN